MIISMFGCSLSVVIIYSKKKNIMILFQDLEDFNKFGKPFDNDNVTFYIKWLTIICVTYSTCGSLLYSLCGIYNAKFCEDVNDSMNLKLVCGAIVYYWLPETFINLTTRTFVGLISLFGGYLSMLNGMNYVIVVFSIILCINSRIRHLGYKFEDAFNCKNKIECRRRVHKCYEYHKDVIR